MSGKRGLRPLLAERARLAGDIRRYAIFTVEEREKLSDLLARAINPDEALTVEGLHGFLFGLAITPEPVMPSEWLPQVFGEAVADFASNVDANETLEYLFGAYHRICILNEQDLLYFPFDMETLKEDDLERIGEWAYGLYAAMCLRLNLWGIDERVITEMEMTDEDRYLSASCSVILGVAVPESVPELFEDARQSDMGTITAILYAALPEAVSTLRDHARKVKKPSPTRRTIQRSSPRSAPAPAAAARASAAAAEGSQLRR